VKKVETHEELIRVAVELLGDAAKRRQLSESAHVWHEANRGATARTLAVIRSTLAGTGRN
jgi:3-deoxy-D-manno-octulosonic-acid transferase